MMIRTSAVAFVLGMTLVAEGQTSIFATKEFNVDLAGHFIPAYSNGFMFLVDDERQSVTQYDLAGATVRTISIPNAVNPSIADVASSADGRIAVSFSSVDESGRTAGAIAWFSASGAIDRIVRTNSYGAARVVFAADGTLWAAGRPHDVAFNTVPGADIIRHYDRQGMIIGSAVSNKSFKHPRALPTEDSFLAASNDRIVFYSNNQSELIEISNDGNVIGRYRLTEVSPRWLVTGMAVTPGNAIYISVGTPSPSLYKFARTAHSFVPVDTGTVGRVLLYGVDSNQLVVSTSKPQTLTWLNP